MWGFKGLSFHEPCSWAWPFLSKHFRKYRHRHVPQRRLLTTQPLPKREVGTTQDGYILQTWLQGKEGRKKNAMLTPSMLEISNLCWVSWVWSRLAVSKLFFRAL